MDLAKPPVRVGRVTLNSFKHIEPIGFKAPRKSHELAHIGYEQLQIRDFARVMAGPRPRMPGVISNLRSRIGVTWPRRMKDRNNLRLGALVGDIVQS